VGTVVQSVTKEVFLTAVGCRTAGWFLRHAVGEAPPTPGESLRMEEGNEVHRRARSLFPQGVSAMAPGATAAAMKTARLMADNSLPAIYEATFHVKGYVARADILTRLNGGWHLIEVKSDTSDKDELLDDLAYTAMVAQRGGLKVAKASLLLVSKDFRLGMADEKLFTEVDRTDDLKARVKEFLPFWEDVDTQTKQPKRPAADLTLDCRKCPYFGDICLGKGIEDHIFDLPRLSQRKFDDLEASGVVTIPKIPKRFDLTEPQERVRQSVVRGKPVVETSLAPDLATVVWPAYYLDFETVMTAMPLYPKLAPYTQLPTQYSLHVCSAPGQVTAHHEYLADPSRDCRRELAEKLIADVGKKGSVISYSSFENTVIGKLADHFPDLAKPLHAIQDRIVDLEAILRNGFYHPDFHGRTSIKVTLPVLVQNMSYAGLEIGDGDTAVAMFARMAKGQVGKAEVERIRKALLVYCGQDTMAMVKLHEKLKRLTGVQGNGPTGVGQ